MFTARITRKVGERIVKEGIQREDLYILLNSLAVNYDYFKDEILEIHIVREK